MFERETHKEKMLEQAKKQMENLKKNVHKEQGGSKNADLKRQEKIREVEEFFFKSVKSEMDEGEQLEQGISEQYTKQKTNQEIVRKPSDRSEKREEPIKSNEYESKQEPEKKEDEENDGDYQEGTDNQQNQENEHGDSQENQQEQQEEGLGNNEPNNHTGFSGNQEQEALGEAENDGDI